MNFFYLAIAILSCYRLAKLISWDDGPGEIFFRLRLRAGTYDYGENGKPRTFMGSLLGCPYCVGIWIALPIVIFLYGLDEMTFILWMAVSGGQFLLQCLGESESE